MFLLAAGGVYAFIAWPRLMGRDPFLAGFARLLGDFRVESGSPFTAGCVARGRHVGRDVVIRIHWGGELTDSELVVAVKTGGHPSLVAADVDSYAKGDAARRALFTLAVEQITLKVVDGWLQAHWHSLGSRMFPGPFSEAKWRKVLDSLNAVASSLEAPQA